MIDITTKAVLRFETLTSSHLHIIEYYSDDLLLFFVWIFFKNITEHVF